jgi:3',5'-cyclic AMP phosphodiesterase CpdA
VVVKLKIIFAAAVFFLSSCELDVLGIFVSEDLDKRLKYASEFNFVKDEWRSLKVGDNYNFIVVSDTHIIGSNAHKFENLKNHINGAKFVVVTGDITQSGTSEELNRFIEISESLGVPCFPVIGNHDIYFNDHNWHGKIGSTRYRIDTDTSTLFILDSANAFFGEEQIAWFESELKTAKPDTFIFTHDNFFTDNIPNPQRQQFTNYLERSLFISLLNEKCKAVFSGHIHKRVINHIKNTDYVTLEDFIGHKVICRVFVSGGAISWQFENF